MPFEFVPRNASIDITDRDSVVMKNWQKWWEVESVARADLHGVVPMKMPFQGDALHPTNLTVETLLRIYPRVGRIIDLQSDGAAYEAPAHVERIRMTSKSKQPPSPEVVAEFISHVQPYMRANPGRLVGVHCHYGFNRTGFLVCAYLCECCGVGACEAIQMFAAARPPGIKHEHFKEELHRRYMPRGGPLARLRSRLLGGSAAGARGAATGGGDGGCAAAGAVTGGGGAESRWAREQWRPLAVALVLATTVVGLTLVAGPFSSARRAALADAQARPAGAGTHARGTGGGSGALGGPQQAWRGAAARGGGGAARGASGGGGAGADAVGGARGRAAHLSPRPGLADHSGGVATRSGAQAFC